MAPLPLLAVAALLILSTGISGISGIPAVPAQGRSPPERPALSQLLSRRTRSPSSSSWLRWAPFSGRVPPDAVSSRSRRSQPRPEFICRTPECHLGSFDPERGSFCVYTWGEKEFHGLSFSLLVNPGGFEALDWVDASFGDAPEGAVQPCPPSDSFVGRSRDGVGKVSRELQALFVSVEGEEVWYKWYQVLAVRQRPAEVSVGNVTYNGSAATERAESAALAEVPVRNGGCGAERRPLRLEEATERERSWSAELPALAETRGVLRAPPLLLTESGWRVGNVTSLPWAGGASVTEFVSRLHEVTLEVPARSECSAVLRGLRRELRVPFSASLTREFRSGPPHRVEIAGWALSRAVTAVRARLERCRMLEELPPCPD